MRTSVVTTARRARRARPAIAAGIALLALLLAVGPVAAAEHYRSAAALREFDGGPKIGSAYLDRYFGGSPPGPTKTTLRVVVPKATSGTYSVRIFAGVCFSEGFELVRLAAKATSTVAGSTKLDRTMTLTTAQRRKLQQAYDTGSPIGVVLSKGDWSACGQFGRPKYIP